LIHHACKGSGPSQAEPSNLCDAKNVLNLVAGGLDLHIFQPLQDLFMPRLCPRHSLHCQELYVWQALCYSQENAQTLFRAWAEKGHVGMLPFPWLIRFWDGIKIGVVCCIAATRAEGACIQIQKSQGKLADQS